MLLSPGDEFIYRDAWGGISLLFAANQTSKTLMPNTTFVSMLLVLNQVFNIECWRLVSATA